MRGGPAVSLCSFTPVRSRPGNSSAAVVMSITTTASSSRSPYVYALWVSLPGLAFLSVGKNTLGVGCPLHCSPYSRWLYCFRPVAVGKQRRGGGGAVASTRLQHPEPIQL